MENTISRFHPGLVKALGKKNSIIFPLLFVISEVKIT